MSVIKIRIDVNYWLRNGLTYSVFMFTACMYRSPTTPPLHLYLYVYIDYMLCRSEDNNKESLYYATVLNNICKYIHMFCIRNRENT